MSRTHQPTLLRNTGLIDTGKHPGSEPRHPGIPQDREAIDVRAIAKPALGTRILYGVLDVLPIPNIHEIVKSLRNKDERCRKDVVHLIGQTLLKLDVPRTIVAVVTGTLLILM